MAQPPAALNEAFLGGPEDPEFADEFRERIEPLIATARQNADDFVIISNELFTFLFDLQDNGALPDPIFHWHIIDNPHQLPNLNLREDMHSLADWIQEHEIQAIGSAELIGAHYGDLVPEMGAPLPGPVGNILAEIPPMPQNHPVLLPALPANVPAANAPVVMQNMAALQAQFAALGFPQQHAGPPNNQQNMNMNGGKRRPSFRARTERGLKAGALRTRRRPGAHFMTGRRRKQRRSTRRAQKNNRHTRSNKRRRVSRRTGRRH